MEATKVKVRERDLAVRRHRTWHRILFLPPHPTPLHSSPLLASSPPRPRARFGIPVPRPASKTTPSYRKIELWWKPRPSWNRVTLRHACHVIAVRVSPRALRSRFRERLKSKKKKTKRRESLSFHSLSLFDRRADSRYLRIDNRRGTTVIHIDRWLRNATREWWTFTFNHGVVTLCVGMSAR